MLVEQVRTRQFESRDQAERLTINLTMCRRALTNIRQFEAEMKIDDAVKNKANTHTGILRNSKRNADPDVKLTDGDNPEVARQLAKQLASAKHNSVFMVFDPKNHEDGQNCTNQRKPSLYFPALIFCFQKF